MSKTNGKRLYEVRLLDGGKNPNHLKYCANAAQLNVKAIDLQGSVVHGFVSHHMDEETVHLLLTDGFKRNTADTLQIVEVTKRSLQWYHEGYVEQIQDRFLRFDFYPNIEE